MVTSTKVGRKFIEIGYMSGIAVSFLGLLASAIYLLYFLSLTPDPAAITDDIKLLSVAAERRMLLLSTAIFVAMSFGFLGFALFLIQAEGDVDGEAEIGDYKMKFARLSPGLFVILCATAIIIVASTHEIRFTKESPQGSPAPHTPVIADPDVDPDKL